MHTTLMLDTTLVISNFKLYSAYYDLLYQDKDYKSEAAYVHHHLRQLLPEAKQLLELGSGTGNHARYLCEYNYNITGVERSEEMIELAKRKAIKCFHPVLSDITNFELDHQYDAAVSLFHSMCYLTTNDQLLVSFKNVSKHLKAGGIFAFDFWYGPAVLYHLPVARTKYQQNEFIEVSRRGETTMDIKNNIAEVNYEIVVKDKKNGSYNTIREKHPMRYFSIPEIALIANETGFNAIGFEEFLTGNQPTLESWNIFVILQKTA
jgi:SAM-dependent methyltransferase